MGFFDKLKLGKLKNMITEGAEVQILAPQGQVDLEGHLEYHVVVRAKRDVRLKRLTMKLDRQEYSYGSGPFDSALGDGRDDRDTLASAVVVLNCDLAAGEVRECTGSMGSHGVGEMLGTGFMRGLDQIGRGLSQLRGDRVRYFLTASVSIEDSVNAADTTIEVSVL